MLQPFSMFFFIFNSLVCVGKLIHSMVAHLDAVTSLAVDPNGLYLMSGSKYSVPTTGFVFFRVDCIF